MTAAYLLPVGAPIEARSTEPWERALDYMIGLISENATFMAAAAAALEEPTRLNQLWSEATRGQAMLYCLSVWQMEVLNGGFAQFFVNADGFKGEIERSLRLIGCDEQAVAYSGILTRRNDLTALLEEVWTSTSDDHFSAYERFRTGLDPEAAHFEKSLFPAFADGKEIAQPHAVAIGNGIVRYVESHRHEYQQPSLH